MSLPAVVNRNGVGRVMRLPLDGSEEWSLRESAAVLRGVLDELALD